MAFRWTFDTNEVNSPHFSHIPTATLLWLVWLLLPNNYYFISVSFTSTMISVGTAIYSWLHDSSCNEMSFGICTYTYICIYIWQTNGMYNNACGEKGLQVKIWMSNEKLFSLFTSFRYVHQYILLMIKHKVKQHQSLFRIGALCM